MLFFNAGVLTGPVSNARFMAVFAGESNIDVKMLQLTWVGELGEFTELEDSPPQADPLGELLEDSQSNKVIRPGWRWW